MRRCEGQVTPDDQKSYQLALLRSRERSEGRRPDMNSSEGRRGRLSSEDRIPLPEDLEGQSEDGARGIPAEHGGGEDEQTTTADAVAIQTSEFELVEETERGGAVAVPGGSGAIGAIGVRAFKLLQMLRDLHEGGNAGAAAATPSTPTIARTITTVSTLSINIIASFLGGL